jgi:hypothetical protein
MRYALRGAALLFAWGGSVGLLRLAAIFSSHLASWFQQWPGWWAVGLLPLAVAFWWLSAKQAATERKAQVTPRRVSGVDGNPPVAELQPCDAQQLLIVHPDRDMESAAFASDLMIAIGNAGWWAQQRPHKGPVTVHGLRVEVIASATKEQRASAKVLIAWLRREGFTVGRLRTMPQAIDVPVLPNSNPIAIGMKLTIGGR